MNSLIIQALNDYHLNGNILSIVIKTLRERSKVEQIFPTSENIFKAFLLCPYSKLRVVMIGQDPYPQPNIATGILFGNKEGSINLSPSLKLVKDRVYQDFYFPYNEPKFDCTLESWAKQGILMLNTALTVKANCPGSHAEIWKPFMIDLLTKLSMYNSGIIYLLFGNPAKALSQYINHNTNYVFSYYHPAYFARVGLPLDCDGFKKVNEILKANHNITIKF